MKMKKNILTGSFPSIASSQSFRLDSEKACSVMIPGLSKIYIYTEVTSFFSPTAYKVRIKMHVDVNTQKIEKLSKFDGF